jgi:hypothetical protein
MVDFLALLAYDYKLEYGFYNSRHSFLPKPGAMHPVQVQHRSTNVPLAFLASGKRRRKKIRATRFAGGC